MGREDGGVDKIALDHSIAINPLWSSLVDGLIVEILTPKWDNIIHPYKWEPDMVSNILLLLHGRRTDMITMTRL